MGFGKLLTIFSESDSLIFQQWVLRSHTAILMFCYPSMGGQCQCRFLVDADFLVT